MNKFGECEAFRGHSTFVKYVIDPNHHVIFMAQCTNFEIDVESLQQIKLMLCNYSIVCSKMCRVSPTYSAITNHTYYLFIV